MRVQINLPQEFVEDLRRRNELVTEIEEAEEDFDSIEEQIAELERERDEKRGSIEELEQEQTEVNERIAESAPEIFENIDIDDLDIVRDLPRPTVNLNPSRGFSIGDYVTAQSTLDYTDDIVVDLFPGARGRITDFDNNDNTWRVEWENIFGGHWHKPEQIKSLV